MAARQVIGAREMERIVVVAEPEPVGGTTSQKNKAWAQSVQDIAEEIVDQCVRYRNANIDDWGLVSHIQTARTALEGLMRGVRG